MKYDGGRVIPSPAKKIKGGGNVMDTMVFLELMAGLTLWAIAEVAQRIEEE